MEIGSIMVISAIALVVAAYLSRPLLNPEGVAVSETERRLSTLEAERDHVLSVIREMDLDYAMGKIAPEDYQTQRAEMVSQGAAVLRQMDVIAEEVRPASGEHKARGEAGSDKELEALLEATVAGLRQASPVSRAGYCERCGQQLVVGDRFCSACGKPVRQETVR